VSRFEQFAIRGYMSRVAFKESLGIFGIDSLGFLSDRMFQVMDEESEERIKLVHYLGYFDVMLHGSEEEKMRQSFDLLDLTGTHKINYGDFREIAQSFAQMWSAALGYPMPLNRYYIKSVF
jgi:Ca2+-binding EF-hand superfamily protein